jgi:peptide deformylase
MNLIPIVTDKEKLSKVCSPVSEEEGKHLGELLVEQLKARRDTAVGLAANQIGIDARVFSMVDNGGYRFFANPEIVEKSEGEMFMDEGCLSLPGQKSNTFRYQKIVAKDLFNERIELQHFAAIVFQHELDHLNGILMSEREVGPYKLCPCGSGKKFKFCHMK